ncbi:MAG: arsenic resistance N-acetyltransferase ArsN2 [Gammaproteobacteria bacterium]
MKFHLNPDSKAVVELLGKANLPTADITPHLLSHFIGASIGGTLEGVIGYEPYGEIGLLRSLAVSSTARGAGLGAQLVQRLETAAAEAGIEHLFLLTTDADGYFASRNYRVIDRDAVPEEIRGTAQFSSLCPDSATVMVKTL